MKNYTVFLLLRTKNNVYVNNSIQINTKNVKEKSTFHFISCNPKVVN